MRRFHLVIVALLFLIAIAVACDVGRAEWKTQKVDGEGAVVRVSHEVSDFTSVHLATLGTLYVTIGKTEALEIEAEENLQEYFVTEVHEGNLRIKTRRKFNLRPKEPVKFFVTVKRLDAIALSSSGDADIEMVGAESMNVALSSSGGIKRLGD